MKRKKGKESKLKKASKSEKAGKQASKKEKVVWRAIWQIYGNQGE